MTITKSVTFIAKEGSEAKMKELLRKSLLPNIWFHLKVPVLFPQSKPKISENLKISLPKYPEIKSLSFSPKTKFALEFKS